MAVGRWQMADGRWQMADGRWQMADGRWQMADGRWQMADGRWQMADSRWQIAIAGNLTVVTAISDPGFRISYKQSGRALLSVQSLRCPPRILCGCIFAKEINMLN